MRHHTRLLSVLALLALSACTAREDIGPNTTVTCGSASDCPGGRVCNRARCVNPDAIDTTPPDLVAGSVVVSPPRVRAGQAFTVSLQVTEALEAPPQVALGLVPPVLLDCTAASSVAYACAHTATGHENADLGGDLAVDVRMRDLAGNDTARSSVATVTFDFAPPSPTLASVAYDPAPSNPLASVRMATGGTRVRVAVSADERLSASAPPSLRAHAGGVTLPFALAAGGLGDVDAVFATTVPAGQPDGDYALEVAWTDEVGNVGTATVPDVVVKVKTSRPSLSVNQAAVVFVRSPWGNASPEELGGYTIPAGAYFALEPADPLSPATRLPAGTFLLDGGIVPERLQVRAGTMTVGTLRPEPGGTWPRTALASPDTFTVEVVGYDDAGNASDPQAIGTVEWVATSNLPPTGTTPHTLRQTPLVEASRVQRTEIDRVAEADVGGADGLGALAVAQAVWRKMTFGAPPGKAIVGAAVAYDSARGRVMMFGGQLSSSTLQSISEWDGRAWTDVTPPSGSPDARYGAALAYDAARGRAVLFGGYRREGALTVGLGDTWEWDGTRWASQAPAAPPPRRGDAGMTYDSARGRVVLHGGYAEGTTHGDTWEWDGTSWTRVALAGATPGPMSRHGLAYDPSRGRSVLVSGAAGAPVWEWDGATWTSVTPARAGATPSGSAIVAAPVGAVRRVVLHGTWSDGAADHAGAWGWDGVLWTTLAVPGTAPAIGGTAVVYDAARDRTVALTDRYGTYDWTWEWDGAVWRSVLPNGKKPGPGYMYANALAYDSTRRRTVLWGVTGPSPWDTWEWDGSTWTSVAVEASGPPRYSSGLAYDPARQRTFVAASADTWTWDGTSWGHVTPATYEATGTLVHDGQTAAEGGAGPRLLAVSGSQAWTWTGTDWVTTTGPSVSHAWRAVFDTARRRVVLFDPNATSQPLLEWTGSAWIEPALVGTTPSRRSSAAIAFDSERGRTVLFGGMGCGTVCQDSWEWDGTRWRNVTPPGTKPAARRFHSMTYDSGRHRTVLWSGNDFGGDIYWDDTWELEARPGTRPAIQLDVSTARTGIAPRAMTRLRVRAWAGGAFTVADPGAVGFAGATLRGWATHSPESGSGGWIPLATNDAAVGAAAPYLGAPATTLLDWQAPVHWGAPGDAAGRLVTERDGQLSFQVVPSGTMGPDPRGARVALDFIEVRIRYAAVP
jgi:hypothetical protein